MGELCSTQKETHIVFLLQRELKGRYILEDISVDGKVILHFILDVCGVLNLVAWLHGSKVKFFEQVTN